jgi:hypothetical protein
MNKKGQLPKVLYSHQILKVGKTVGQYHHKNTKSTEKEKKLCALRDFLVKSFGEPMKLSILQILKRHLTPREFRMIAFIAILRLASVAIAVGNKELVVWLFLIVSIALLLGQSSK